MKGLTRSDIHHKVVREVTELLVVFIYLAIFFCSFTLYRQLVMNEMGISYFHYGAALLKALVLSKVILLGKYARITRRLDNQPLMVPTLYKVFVFAVFALAFELLEHAVGDALHGKPMRDALWDILRVGWDELLARTLVILVAFLPLFAFREVGRVLGEGKLLELFFKKRPPTTSGEGTSD